MNKSDLKQVIKEFVSPETLHRSQRLVQRAQLARSGAATAFARASAGPAGLAPAHPGQTDQGQAWLGKEKLAQIESRFIDPVRGLPSVDAPDPNYSEAAIAARAQRRFRLIRKMLGADYARCETFLETGAADAMVAREFMLDGKVVLATDIQDHERDPRTLRDNVPFALMSATDLHLPDASQDVLFSFDSMEHFDDPTRAMDEAARVVKPGGFVYLRFGPLYQSPDGMHLGTRLRVPYASVLFERSVIDAYMQDMGRAPLNHDYCNGWTRGDFRRLFDQVSDRFSTRLFLEHVDLSGLALIREFPTCFRAKSDQIDDFLVGIIEVLFQRR